MHHKMFSSNIVRGKSTLARITDWYRALWDPKVPIPPYNHICQLGDPTLRLKAEPIKQDEISSKRIQDVLLKMRGVMNYYRSVGISAPQIGIPLRIIMVEIPKYVIDHFGPEVCKMREMQQINFKVFINPLMEVQDYKMVAFPEACESIKGLSALVPRYKRVVVKGFEYDGSPVEWEASGWAARIVQHEMDHLDGKMYTDKMDFKTLQVDHWEKVNSTGGDFRLNYKQR